MVRLVKGAYWDSEIKRAQLDGQAGYPVYTRKAYTDVAYLACARQLLAAPDAVYPQFATHNAHTLAAVWQLAGGAAAVSERYEFQCLHGMGEALYEQVVAPAAAGRLGRACRIYAPVGTHETLLAYLVRRLLENGANTSFVQPHRRCVAAAGGTGRGPGAHRAADGRAATARSACRTRRSRCRRRCTARRAPTRAGLDLADEATLVGLGRCPRLQRRAVLRCRAADRRTGSAAAAAAGAQPGRPARRGRPGARGLGRRCAGCAGRGRGGGRPLGGHAAGRARRRARTRRRRPAGAAGAGFIALLVREAGKTAANAVAEVREAVDFLRYYADAGAPRLATTPPCRPLGPVVCISPWNFPLAIFTGQVAAALAAGNPVLAKPAEQTPLVAALAVQLLHAGRRAARRAATAARPRRDGRRAAGGRCARAGRALHRLHRSRAAAAAHAGAASGRRRPAGAADRRDRRAERDGGGLVGAGRAGGGRRCELRPSTAPASAARHCACCACSDDVAERMLQMLDGAVRELRVGDPRALATDVGPVIDDEARAGIERHLQRMAARGRRVRCPAPPGDTAHGSFVTPTIDRDRCDRRELQREVFGPVLHVLRYEREGLDALLAQINATGYGADAWACTRGSTRPWRRWSARRGPATCTSTATSSARWSACSPSAAKGLSGTGPKAGGPLYLLRLLPRAPAHAARRAVLAAGAAPAGPPLRGLSPGDARRRCPGAIAAAGPDKAAGRPWRRPVQAFVECTPS